MLGVIVIVQSVVLVAIGLFGEKMPAKGAILGFPLLEIGIGIAVLSLASMCLGLLISALVSTSEKAMPFLVLLTMAQVILSGGVVSLVGKSGLVLTMDYTAWGWTHIVLGLLLAGLGAALFTGRMWARVGGVLVAGLSILAAFSFANAYPLWSVVVIAVDVFVIYALTVHGREIRDF